MFVFQITNFSPVFLSLVTQYLVSRERYYKSWLGICQGSKGSVVLISVVYKYIIMREKYRYLEFFWSVFRCFVSLRIQSKCGKIRTRKTPNTDTFHAVLHWKTFHLFFAFTYRDSMLSTNIPQRCW